MSDWKNEIARRPLLAAALALVGAGALGGIAYETGLFRRHVGGPYGDLLAALDDVGNAAILGAAHIADTPSFDASQTAAQLRKRMHGKSLGDVLSADVTANRLIEIKGWVLPETLALLCALAAKNG